MYNLGIMGPFDWFQISSYAGQAYYLNNYLLEHGMVSVHKYKFYLLVSKNL